MSSIEVAIPGHTTGADPRPHIVYEVLVTQNDVGRTIHKRYSDFTALQALIQAPYALPPKRILATSLVPSAWADATLIEERIIGLYNYLISVLADPLFAAKPDVTAFLGKNEDTSKPWDDEDALPSTMGVAQAANVKATLARVAEEESGDRESAAFAPGEEDPANKAPVQRHATYYPDWSAGSLPPENLWFGKFDIIYFAFAIPTSANTISIGGASVLRRLVNAANGSGKGTKIVLSVGGWGGSQYFSQAASSAANRSKFIGSMSSAVKTYGLAGVDIDWEYPNSAGAGNPHSSKDAANFLTLLQGLRANLGASKIISSAVPHNPWLGSSGSPLTNVSAYAKEMSWVNIMNYDVWGASSTPGPNAPLGNNCGTSKQPGANATAAFAAWTKAGWPASKLFLGLPLYGYVSRSTKTTLSGSFVDPGSVRLAAEEEVEVDGEEPTPVRNAKGQVVLAEDEGGVALNGAHPHAPTTAIVHAPHTGDGFTTAAADDTVRAQASLSSWIGQQIPFYRIVQAGALKKQADGSYAGAGGFKRGWDSCSTTPFIYYQSQSTFVSYDDPSSLAAKAKYALSKGMAGTFTWSIDQDDGHVLTDAIRTASGRAPPSS